jgi:hypothetical protein
MNCSTIIYLLIFAAHCGTISSGIAFFSSKSKDDIFCGKLCGKDKFETLIFQQLFIFLFLQPNVEKFWIRASLF